MTETPINRYQIPLALSSWAVFVISLTFYWITVDPSVSYWDCPEYVTQASKMEVGHPPGNPVWVLAMRVATIFFVPEHHALVVNLCSGVLMAFAAFFLCRLIFIPVRLGFDTLSFRAISPQWKDISGGLVAGGAALCFALCDSAWFSAVEAEVYAMSTFLSALSLWIMMMWWWTDSKGKATRLLILLAYIMGLSLGVHQLNLLLIPVFAFVIYYRRNRKPKPPIRLIFVFIISLAIIGAILMVIMPVLLTGAGYFELFAVNHLKLPYDTGVIIFAVALTALIVAMLIALNNRGKFEKYSIPLWMAGFLWLGFSSFGIILIRAKAYPLMNEGVPDNIFSLQAYLARDQYPSPPLVYGATPYSKPLLVEEFIDGKPIYRNYVLEKGKPLYISYEPDGLLNNRSRMITADDSLSNLKVIENGYGYVLRDYRYKQKLTPELNMWFPRITSLQTSDLTAYEDWAGMTPENMDKMIISEVVDSTGRARYKMYDAGQRRPTYSYRPTYLQNLRFFIAYQSYFMYFRYLFWNFIGRQNDYPSMGEIEHGNFITGLPAIDKYLGVTDEIPPEIYSENEGRNRYFGIPFIIGIIGALWLLGTSWKSRRLFTLIMLLFLMTGLAIVVYLNQSPGEPRERDYTFLVSYMAFTMWIGAGIMALAKCSAYFTSLLQKRVSKKDSLKSSGLSPAVVTTIIIFSFGVPTLMAIENFNDHDRRGRFETTFYASSILDFEYPAVIFSNGDNSTFPQWYASEVLGIGEEHTPVDISYLSMPDYVENIKKQGKKGFNFLAPTPNIRFGAYLLTKLPADTDQEPMPIKEALEKFYSYDSVSEFPVSKVKVPVNADDSIVINLRSFTNGSSYLSFRHLMLLDMVAKLGEDQSKVLYFPSVINHSFYKPLDPALGDALLGKIYAPGLSDIKKDSLFKVSLQRELLKLRNLEFTSHYADPDMERNTHRYRGELIIAAQRLLNEGDVVTAGEVADLINEKLPYSYILPGTMTIADTTFYEGEAYIRLQNDLYVATSLEKYRKGAVSLDSLMDRRHRQWLRYYRSLSPSERATLSPRSLRLIRERQKI